MIPLGALRPGSPEFTAKFGDSAVTTTFLKATLPEGVATRDPNFKPGSDRTEYRIALPTGVAATDVTVTATLYSQAIPPYYLKQRFETAPNGPATRRLYYLASRLQTEGTIIQDWKLKVTGAEAMLTR